MHEINLPWIPKQRPFCKPNPETGCWFCAKLCWSCWKSVLLLQKVNCFQRSNETFDDKHFKWLLIGVITTRFVGKYTSSLAQFCSRERKFSGAKVPGRESSIYGTFVPGRESTWERSTVLWLRDSYDHLACRHTRLKPNKLKHNTYEFLFCCLCKPKFALNRWFVLTYKGNKPHVYLGMNFWRP